MGKKGSRAEYFVKAEAKTKMAKIKAKYTSPLQLPRKLSLLQLRGGCHLACEQGLFE